MALAARTDAADRFDRLQCTQGAYADPREQQRDAGERRDGDEPSARVGPRMEREAGLQRDQRADRRCGERGQESPITVAPTHTSRYGAIIAREIIVPV